jgi:hypothetical protein
VRRIAVWAGLAGVLLLMIGVTALGCVTDGSRPCRSSHNAKTVNCRGRSRDRGKAVAVGLGLIVAVGGATFLITRVDEISTL